MSLNQNYSGQEILTVCRKIYVTNFENIPQHSREQETRYRYTSERKMLQSLMS